ncbi:MAG: FkbM family methyltransferase [Persephonella sp.]|nr:FkbM family methyltransferase [Persephonella sp.]
MKNLEKIFYRTVLAQLKPLRETYFILNKEKLKDRFHIVKMVSCDCYLLIDAKDEYGIFVLRNGRVETPEDKYINKLIKKGSCILDIGGHWGGFAVQFGKLVGEKGKVFSFEPSKKNFNMLKKNIRINNLDNIVFPFNFAVGSHEDTVKFPISATSSGHNSLIRKDIPVNRYEYVKQIVLDKFLATKDISKIDFIKIDVEGYELEVLKGLEKTIDKSDTLVVFMEFSPQFMGLEKTKETLDFLKRKFKSVKLCHKKKIFETDWETVRNVSIEKGQRNIFLFK